jgi:hypothetical protein
MSILKVDTINEKTTGNGVVIPSGQTLDVSAGTLVPSSDQIVQVQTKTVANSGWSTTSTSAVVAVTNWYVDITPTKSTNLLVWKTSITSGTTVVGSYGRFNIYDTNTGSIWSSGSYIAQTGYNGNANEWEDTPIYAANTAGTTSAMRLQLYAIVGGSSATLSNSWAGGDNRLIEVMEVEQ